MTISYQSYDLGEMMRSALFQMVRLCLRLLVLVTTVGGSGLSAIRSNTPVVTLLSLLILIAFYPQALIGITLITAYGWMTYPKVVCS